MSFELRGEMPIREQLIVSKSGPEPHRTLFRSRDCAAISTVATGT
jgi:hypothetical protein